MKYSFVGMAVVLVLVHDFLDHLDGVAAKQNARDGRSKGENGVYVLFLDAQADKVVFCFCLWSYLILVEWTTGDYFANFIIGTTAMLLFPFEP